MPILSALNPITSRGWMYFQQQAPLTFDQPVGDLPIVDDARWSAALTSNSWGALLVWIVLLIVLQAASWPIVRRIFTRLPDRGWAFSRLITMLVAGYAVWFLASVHIISFRAIWAAVAIALLGLASWLVSRKIPIRAHERSIRSNPIAVTAELIFWGTFGLFLLYRAINPDAYHIYWGGEKAMEFAHINSILRSAHFPPVDPWYAGGFINYYYYGTYLVAFLIKLTGIPVEIAFNLAQPTFPALLASASFSITAAIGRRITGSTFGAWISGIVGMFFIQIAGNLVAAERVIDRAANGLGLVDNWRYWVWAPSRAIDYTITEFPYFGALFADLHPHVIAMPFTILIVALAWQVTSMWRAIPLMVVGRSISSRQALSVIIPLGLSSLAIGSLFMTNAWDMPLFAIMIAVSIFMLTLGVPGIWRRLGMTVAIVAVVGLLAFAFTVPFNMHYVALFSEIGSVTTRTPLLRVEAHFGAQILLTTFGMAALMVPRSTWNRRTQTTIGIGALLILAGALLLQWWTHAPTSTSPTIGESAVVLATIAVWLISVLAVVESHPELARLRNGLIAGIVAIAAVVLLLIVLERHTLALYAGIGLAAGIMWIALRRPSERFLAMLIAGATLLGASLEIVYLVDNLDGTDSYRMNTVFKFYNHVWNLLGIATGVLTGYAVWHALVFSDEPRESPAPVRSNDQPTRIWTWVTAATVVPMTFASLAYAVVATPIRLDTRMAGATGVTLNTYDWMRYGEIPLFRVENGQTIPQEPLRYADDLEAINWLNENVDGTPVIAEAVFGTYRCNGSRFSISTGLPAVIGWVNHQTQQRDAPDLWAREADMRELYTTTDVARQVSIIDQYDVEYVIVGQTERHYPNPQPSNEGCVDTGSESGIASLESLEGSRLEVAFESESTTIYRVIGE